VPVAVALSEGDFDTEEVVEFFGGDQFFSRAIGNDAAGAHHNDAGDLGQDVGEVVRHHNDSSSLLGDQAQGFAEFALGSDVKGVGRFVEQEHTGLMDEGAGDHDTALLAGGHLADEFVFQMSSLHEFECGVSAGVHLGCDVQVGPERGGGEKSGDDGIDTAGDAGALAWQVRFDDAEVLAELRDVPSGAAKQADAGFRSYDGIALACDGLDERGFSAAVGTEDGDVLASCDAEADIVEHDGFSTGYVDMLHVEEFGFGLCGFG
jgi:hypothetical protein